MISDFDIDLRCHPPQPRTEGPDSKSVSVVNAMGRSKLGYALSDITPVAATRHRWYLVGAAESLKSYGVSLGLPRRWRGPGK